MGMDNIIGANKVSSTIHYKTLNEPKATKQKNTTKINPEQTGDLDEMLYLTDKIAYNASAPADKSSAPIPVSSNYAIMVGIENYPGFGNDLTYSIDDIMELKQAIIKSPRWSDSTFVTITDKDATKPVIQDFFNAAAKQIDANGTFLFFFSGHGKNLGPIGYLATYDGLVADSHTVIENMISENDLKNWLSAFPTTVKKIVILDSCHSGAFIGKGLPQKNFFKDISDTVKNLSVMTASEGKETSDESSLLKNSIFTYFLTKGLGNEATIGPADSNGDSNITCLESFNYASSNTKEYNPEQNPQFYNSDNAEDLSIKH